MTARKIFSILGIVVLVIVVTLLSNFYLAKPQTTQTAVKEDSVYDRVMKSGKIRCAYAPNSPSFFKDPNTGKPSGIFAEAMERAAALLQLQVEWTEEVTYGTVTEGLNSNRYDAFCAGIWQNALRARVEDFSAPLYYSAVNAYVRADESRYADASALNGPNVRIATIDGEMSDILSRTSFPNASKVALPQSSDMAQMLLNVTTGKADVAFAEAAVAAEFEAHNPGQLKNLTSKKPLRVFGYTIVFKQNQPQFKELIDTAFGQLVNNGDIQELIEKYQPGPGSFLLNAYPYRDEQ